MRLDKFIKKGKPLCLTRFMMYTLLVLWRYGRNLTSYATDGFWVFQLIHCTESTVIFPWQKIYEDPWTRIIEVRMKDAKSFQLWSFLTSKWWVQNPSWIKLKLWNFCAINFCWKNIHLWDIRDSLLHREAPSNMADFQELPETQEKTNKFWRSHHEASDVIKEPKCRQAHH